MAGVNRRDFQSLALVRLAEAKALLTVRMAHITLQAMLSSVP